MVIIVELLFVKQSMNYNYIILRFIYITLLYYIILYNITLNLTVILLLNYSYLKVAMVRLYWRGLDCGN